MKKEIQALKSKFYTFAEQVLAPKKYIRFSEKPQHDGSPHIEYGGNEFLFIVTERGERYDEKRTTDPDEILFWLVSDLTWSMASDYELD